MSKESIPNLTHVIIRNLTNTVSDMENEVEEMKMKYEKGYISGLQQSIGHIKNAREFLRGSTYSVDRLVNMMISSIEENIKDLTDSTRIMCDKGKVDE